MRESPAGKLIISNPLAKPEEIQPLRSVPVWIGTVGGFGYAPIAPGTFGSLAGVILFLGLSWLSVSLAAYAGIVVVISLVGIWASGRCEALFAKKDDGRIVIDEVAGQLITLTPVLVFPETQSAGEPSFVFWGLVVTAFVVFRVLDIWKPGPVRKAEQRFEGGLGVMADDLLAGVIGGLLLAASCYVLLLLGAGGGALG